MNDEANGNPESENEVPPPAPPPEAAAPPPPPADLPPPPEGGTTAGSYVDPGEIEQGKTFAILSYALTFIGLPFFLLPVITRDNDFSLYHAKQAMIIWIAAAAVSIISAILSVICIGVIIGLVGGIGLLVINIMGLMNAVNSKVEPVPVIGKYADEWFSGLIKVNK